MLRIDRRNGALPAIIDLEPQHLTADEEVRPVAQAGIALEYRQRGGVLGYDAVLERADCGRRMALEDKRGQGIDFFIAKGRSTQRMVFLIWR